MAQPSIERTPATSWNLLKRLRWPLAATIAVAFAAGRLIEALVLGARAPGPIVADVLGGAAVWLSLTWVGRREASYQAGLETALAEQRALNTRLQRANEHLALLSDATHAFAASASLDETLDRAVAVPGRLLPARAAALLL